MEIFHGQEADHGKNESKKSDFNEALELNLEGKTSEKDRVSPEKSTLLVVFADLRKTTNKVLFHLIPCYKATKSQINTLKSGVGFSCIARYFLFSVCTIID